MSEGTADIRHPQVSRPSPPGPGLLEAGLWSVGCHLIQLAALIILVAGLLWCAAVSFPPSLQESLRLADDLDWETSFLFAGVSSLGAMLLIVPLVRWRVGPQIRAEFGLKRLTLIEIVLIVAAVAPLGMLSDQVYRWGLQWSAAMLEFVPGLQALPQVDAMQLLQKQMSETAYPVLLMAVALAPAVSEEFVFRGLIGRGLIARWGPLCGILLTSVLFAAAHGTPAHILATLPVGICLHALYRLTGNLWSSVLLHGLNNALSVTLMKLQPEATLSASPPLLFASLGYLAVIAALLREHCGTRHLRADQSATLLVPAPSHSALPARQPIGPTLAACSILSYTCLFIWSQLSELR